MTGPYPPPQQPWQNDGSWQQPPPGQQPGPPPQDPAASPSYDLYPQGGGWPDQGQPQQPPAGPAYGPPPGPPAYGPTSAPPYGPTSGPPYGQQPQYGQPGQFMPPGAPQAPQNNNKGWIFGGLAVAAVVVLLVIGFVVVNAMSDDSSDNAGTDTGNSDTNTGDGEDTPAAAKYKGVDDLCALVQESAYSDVLKASGAGKPDTTDYGSGPSMSCYQDLEGNDYDLGTLSTNAAIYDDPEQVSSSFDSYLEAYTTGGLSAVDVPGLGEKAKIVFDDAIIPSAYLLVQDGNLVADVRLSTTEDGIADSKLQTAAEEVMKQMLTGLAA
ncbi:hypothetical protein AB0I28_33920 [Phytomonospora sp. NPDC050363]|uniref:hypothetical protein n=1 Tax=Phytomonospora sp. NPDC050363 TaxID=3155642 RepID=UPI0033E3FF29